MEKQNINGFNKIDYNNGFFLNKDGKSGLLKNEISNQIEETLDGEVSKILNSPEFIEAASKLVYNLNGIIDKYYFYFKENINKVYKSIRNTESIKKSEIFLGKIKDKTYRSAAISRRDFLKLIGGTLFAIGIPSFSFAEGNSKDNIKNVSNEKSVLDDISKEVVDSFAIFFQEILKINFNDKNYLQTSFDTLKQTVVIIGLGTILGKVGINSGIDRSEEEYDNLVEDINDNFFIASLNMVVMGPILEEIIFRLWPSMLFGKGYKVQFLTSLLFGWAHNPTFKGGIPISQFIGGMFFYFLYKNKDLSHSILAHMLHNFVALGLFKIELLYENK